MRRTRLFGIGLLAAAVAALPGVTHATTYKHFTSAPLHFSIVYPSTWTPQYSKSGAYESFNQSNSIALTVNYHSPKGWTIKTFTNALIASFHKAGMTLTAPKFSGNTGGFNGTGKAAGYQVFMKVLTLVDKHGAFSISMAAPPSKFNGVYPTFKHMFDSFNDM